MSIVFQEVKILLKEWPGIYYTQFTHCPECIKHGAQEPYTFICNWFQPNNKLNQGEAVCRKKTNGQRHNVELKYLFPPDGNAVLFKYYYNIFNDKLNKLWIRAKFLGLLEMRDGGWWLPHP